MKIKFIEIQNFRKLKACRVDFSERETIFVGANNSGKTSAMDALRLFFKDGKFTTRDFTLSNWITINKLASTWINNEKPDLSLEPWYNVVPQLDIWLSVSNKELHYVNHLIPTLDWAGGLLGVRLCLEPKDINKFYKEFVTTIALSKSTQDLLDKKKGILNLWPKSMSDYLDRELPAQFEIKAYLLDPTKTSDCENGEAKPQKLPNESIALDAFPFTGLIKIDIINAQRGFSDVNDDNSVAKVGSSLSSQLSDYYSRHLDPTDRPVAEDIEALQSIETAKSSFDIRLKESFIPSLAELEDLNYPGFGNPRINLTSKINAIDGLKHGSAVQFGLLKEDAAADYPLSLPEKYNGLGYQNLISMVFKLIRFRDEWMKVGKRAVVSSEENIIEPLHLVLVEEPEAHLHAQVQQVFIRKAYEVLRNHKNLKSNERFSTQIVISTHSNHIAHEIEFTALRYFKRKFANDDIVATSCVVNLSKTFGEENDTTKFAVRYLKTTHCDLFFADAVILIEGSAERMLLPHFIYNHYKDLIPCYISILEIGGSHAHKLRPLIEDLGIITLIVTDIDAVDPIKNGSSVRPERKKGFETNNNVLKSWIPCKKSLDDLLDLKPEDKIHETLPLRVAYQHPSQIYLKTPGPKVKPEEAIPYTFEDSLVIQNIELFKGLTGNGLIKKFSKAAQKTTADELTTELFNSLGAAKKAEFALDLLYLEEPKKLYPPTYIADGLTWLQEKLKYNNVMITENVSDKKNKK